MSEPSRENQLEAILHGYLQAVDAGQNPDREELLRRHPDRVEELREFFANQAKIDRMALALNLVHVGDVTVGADEASNAPNGLTRIRYFGDYELLEEIARGGMGVIYKARQVSLNRIVALKMILAGELASPADVQRFHTEAKAAANLDHPNIVPIYEVGEHQGQHFFSMKLVEGGSLAGAVASGHWRVASKDGQRRTAVLTAAVARAVHHAHQRGILHRDLKPANILLEATRHDGSSLATIPMVTDFGLAKHVAADSGQTKSGVIVGPPSYLPPEQARSDKVLSTAVDIYSVGAILYELLTGRPPFRAETTLQTLLMVLENEPAPPSSVNRDMAIDRDLETICLKCLNKDPARRYGSAEKLAEDLERWLRGEPIAARPVGATERLWRWCQRKPALAAAALSVLLALVTFAVAYYRERANEDRIAQDKLARAQQERDKDRERLRTSFIEQARAERTVGNRERSLDALRKAADIRRDDDLRFEAIATITRPGLRPLGSELHVKTASHGNYESFSSSPIVSSDGNLVAMHIETVFDSQGVPDKNGGIEVYEIPSNKLVRKKTGHYYAIAFRPGTTQLALYPREKFTNVVLWDFATDQEVGTFIHSGTLHRAALSTDGSHLLGEDFAKKMFVWKLADKSVAKAPTQGEFQGFFSANELLLLDQGRYKSWNCSTGAERWLTPSGLKPVIFSTTARLAALFGRGADDANDTLHVWDLADNKRVGTIPGLSEAPNRVDFSPNGHLLVFDDPADLGKSMRVWDVYLGRFTSRLNSPRGRTLPQMYSQRSFNPDGSLLASIVERERAGLNPERSVCIWDTGAGELLATLPDYVGGWDWSDGGQRLVTHFLSIARVWEVTRPLPSYELGKAIKSLSLNRAGDRLAVNNFVCAVVGGDRGPQLAAWDAYEPELFPQFVGKDERWAVHAIQRTTPDIVPVSGASMVGLLASPGSGPLLASGTLFPRSIHRTELRQLTPPKQRMLLSGADYAEQAKSAENLAKAVSKPQFPVSHPFDSVETTEWALSPTAPLLLRRGLVTFRVVYHALPGSGSGTMGQPISELWNYQEGKRLAVLGDHGTCFQFSPDGRRFAMARMVTPVTQALEIWDTASCKVARTLKTSEEGDWNNYGASKLTFSQDGRYLLALRARGERVSVFDVDTGREVRTWTIKQGDWQALALNQDGTLAASGGQDKMIHLWDTVTGRELARWPGHDGEVTVLLFGHDGQTLYSGSQDGTLKLWNLPFIRKELKALNLDW